jgi:hypothetical protein
LKSENNMSGNKEGCSHNPLGIEEARLKELHIKHMDYLLDSIFLEIEGKPEYQADRQETNRRIIEVEAQLKDKMFLH